MKKKILVVFAIFVLVALLLPATNVFAQNQIEKPKDIPQEVWDQLAKDLAEFAQSIFEMNNLLQQMTPEEQKEFIEKITEEILKLQKEHPEIRIKIILSK